MNIDKIAKMPFDKLAAYCNKIETNKHIGELHNFSFCHAHSSCLYECQGTLKKWFNVGDTVTIAGEKCMIIDSDYPATLEFTFNRFLVVLCE